jgi:hypothetical protein
MLFAVAQRGAYSAIQKLESRLKAHRNKVPWFRTAVSPTLLWHSGLLQTQEGKLRAIPGVSVEAADLDDKFWGHSSAAVHSGRAHLLPPTSGCERKVARLGRLLWDGYLVVVKVGDKWHTFGGDEPRLTKVDSDLFSGAVATLGRCLAWLNNQPDSVASAQRLLFGNEQVSNFVGPYWKNLHRIGVILSSLLRGIARFDAGGSVRLSISILRTGPSGVALWEPEAER